MEAIKRIVRIPQNHEIKINVPKHVPENEMVEVLLIMKESSIGFKQKVNKMKEAINDRAFLEDIRDISENFKAIDLEDWK